MSKAKELLDSENRQELSVRNRIAESSETSFER